MGRGVGSPRWSNIRGVVDRVDGRDSLPTEETTLRRGEDEQGRHQGNREDVWNRVPVEGQETVGLRSFRDKILETHDKVLCVVYLALTTESKVLLKKKVFS